MAVTTKNKLVDTTLAEGKNKTASYYIDLEGEFLGFQVRNGKLYVFPGPHGPLEAQAALSECTQTQCKTYRELVTAILAKKDALTQLDSRTKGQRFTLSMLKLFV